MSQTKYETLVDVWCKSHDEFVLYRRECLEFIKKAIIYGFADYLDSPECVTLYNRKEEFNWQKPTGWRQSMSLEDDAFWHFGVALTLEIKNAKKFILFHLALKKEGDEFVIKIEDWDWPDLVPNWQDEFSIHPDKSDELNRLYDTIFNKIKDEMENGLTNFLKQQKKPRLGFSRFENDDVEE